MASLDDLHGFDPAAVSVKGSFEPLPEGWYRAIITQSVRKPSKTGGEYIELTINITQGEYAGRLLWDRLNVKHHNPKAVNFAYARLSSICRAANVLRPRDTEELHNIEMFIYVTQRFDEYSRKYRNEIDQYSARPA
jgi:hypothetical protein